MRKTVQPARYPDQPPHPKHHSITSMRDPWARQFPSLSTDSHRARPVIFQRPVHLDDASPAPGDATRPPPLSVLIIDDDSDSRHLVGNTLLRAGHQVYPATSGQEGLEVAAHVGMDLILLDVVMPGLNGFETCRQLRRIPGCQQVPVIFLTGRSDQNDVVEGLSSGASDYLVKPIQVGELLARVETQARIGQLTRKLEHEVALRTAELQTANRQLRELAVQTSLTEERERQRLAAGLHDDVIQNLALVRKRLAGAGSPPGAPDPLEILDQSVEQLRSLIFELSPPMLYELGLGAALQSLAEQSTKRWGLDFSCSLNGDPSALSTESAVFLYQATRELIANVARHARASMGLIALECDKSAIRVAVLDNGEGIAQDALNAPGSGGFGLFSIRQRIQCLGGELQTTSDNRGTRVTLTLPVQKP